MGKSKNYILIFLILILGCNDNLPNTRISKISLQVWNAKTIAFIEANCHNAKKMEAHKFLPPLKLSFNQKVIKTNLEYISFLLKTRRLIFNDNIDTLNFIGKKLYIQELYYNTSDIVYYLYTKKDKTGYLYNINLHTNPITIKVEKFNVYESFFDFNKMKCFCYAKGDILFMNFISLYDIKHNKVKVLWAYIDDHD